MQITTKKVEAGIILVIEGSIDNATSSAFQESVLNAMNETNKLLLDLDKVDYISSDGLRALLYSQSVAVKKACSMKIIHVQKSINEIFEVSGLSRILHIEYTSD